MGSSLCAKQLLLVTTEGALNTMYLRMCTNHHVELIKYISDAYVQQIKGVYEALSINICRTKQYIVGRDGRDNMLYIIQKYIIKLLSSV